MTAAVLVEAKWALASTTSWALTFTEPVLPGDVVIINCSGVSTGGALFAASGLGGTWTTYTQSSGNNDSMAFIVGRGITSTGTVTVTANITVNTGVSAFLVRGLPNSNLEIAPRTVATGSTLLNGPTVQAKEGQFVVAGIIANSGPASYPAASSLPSPSNWTAYALFNRAAAYASPTGPEQDYRLALGSNAATTLKVTTAILGYVAETKKLRIGSQIPSNIRLGGSPPGRIYKGSTLVWGS